MFVDI